jgi:fermentation-respiration switch protein FrsA (DUF1100 family)
MPLTLKRTKDQAAIETKHPQVPTKPYPYREEEVIYDNKTQNVTLAATLTIPQGTGPFPGVVLITGSGPQDRDESLLGHKPFLILADYLTRHGIAVLRADDRGTGKSTGDFSKATTADLATEAKPEQAAKDASKEQEILELVESQKDPAALDKELRDKMKGEVPDAQIGMQISQVTSVWMRYFLTYDPATALRRVKCPVLVLNGSLDKQVLPDQNLPAIDKALEEAGNKHFEIEELPGLNHLFQTAKTGSPAEYAQIEETMSPIAMDKISNWILKQ